MIVRSTNRLEIPTTNTLRILKSVYSSPQAVPVPGAHTAKIAQPDHPANGLEYTRQVQNRFIF